MKDIIKGFVVLLLLFGMLIIGGYIDTYYTMDCKVTDIQGDKIEIKDTVNNKYIFYGEDFVVGQRVKVTFDNNHTTSRQDDKVVKVKGL